MLTTGDLRVQPLVPPAWNWVALRGLPYHGRPITFFAVRERRGDADQSGAFHLYATAHVDTAHPLDVYDEEVPDQVSVLNPHVRHVALQRARELVICLGNAGAETAVVPIDLGHLVDPSTSYRVDVYNSQRGGWTEGGTSSGGDLRSLAIDVEAGGCRIGHLVALQPPADAAPPA
jgi:hypothetical protein